MKIRVKSNAKFAKTEAFLKKYSNGKDVTPILEKYGAMGVEALRAATPVDSSKTASSWSYKVVAKDKDRYEVQFHNANVVNGVNIAIILQYGHGTRNGGYVKGRDYINPAVRKVFDKMRDELIKEVKRV